VKVSYAARDSSIFFSREPIVAMIIHQDKLPNGCRIAAELKCGNPRRPLILLRGANWTEEILPFGVDAVYYADSRDEGLCKAAAS
jgi:hypothetical protein